MSSPLLFPPVCYRRYDIDHFGRLCRSAIDHRRHSTSYGQCETGMGGQFGVDGNNDDITGAMPGGDDTRLGFRSYNFVWYHPLPGDGGKEDKLAQLCTDAGGHCYGTATPPPLIRPEVIADIRAQARAKFPAPIAQVVELTPRPFFRRFSM